MSQDAFDHEAFQAELDARVEFQMLRYEDAANKLGFLYDSDLEREMAPFFDGDGAVERQLPTISVETKAGCQEALSAAYSTVAGQPRGTWALIERYSERSGERHSSWVGVMSTGGPKVHARQALPTIPSYADVRKSMTSREAYDARHRVRTRRSDERESDLRGQWPVGTTLKGLRTAGQSFSTGHVMAIDDGGKITLKLVKRGSSKSYTAVTTHSGVAAMLKEQAQIEEFRKRCAEASA